MSVPAQVPMPTEASSPADTGARARLRSALGIPALALLVALLALELIAIAYGQAPSRVLASLWEGTWGTGYGVGQVLFKATPLILTGLSVGVAFRAGLFNIGAEGQAALGSLATGLAGAYLPTGTPGIAAIPLACLAGMLAGGVWGAVPGLLKARFGAHEVITTIMMNFIALAFSSWLVVGFFGISETLHTAAIVDGARLWRLEQAFPSLRGSPANAALGLAVVAAAFVGWLLFRSRLGYELRAVGLSPGAAAFGGISVARTTVIVMSMAGMLSGLVGANFVLGYKYYHEEGFSGGIGFLGIAVALLGRSHPAGIIAAALLFGTLSQGGLAINALIPKETMEILQAIIILTVAAASGRLLASRR